MTDEDYMREALALAKTAFEMGEVPVGAVAVWDGKIVGRGMNRRETEKNALRHAEISAIDEACRTLGGWRLWKCDLPKGQLAGEYLVLYGILRIFCEVFREPDAGVEFICGLQRGSFYSIFAILVGVVFIVAARAMNRRNSTAGKK